MLPTKSDSSGKRNANFACPFIVALTSHVDEKVEKNCLQKGFDLVLQGPLTADLADLIVVKFKQRQSQLVDKNKPQKLTSGDVSSNDNQLQIFDSSRGNSRR